MLLPLPKVFFLSLQRKKIISRQKISHNMSGLASKQQSLKIFEKLKTKQANKVSCSPIPRYPLDHLCNLSTIC